MVVCCVGAGGIGSYFTQHIDRLIDNRQIQNATFVVYDDDTVEKKNILYQNFAPKDIGSLKVKALEFRCLNISFEAKRVNVNNLKSYDLVILCADNNLIRREAYEAFTKWNVPFIDARANGKTVGIFSSDTPNYLDTIDSSSDSQSCQNPFQIAKEEIEFGNVIVASILAQCVLSYTRTKKLPNDFITHF